MVGMKEKSERFIIDVYTKARSSVWFCDDNTIDYQLVEVGETMSIYIYDTVTCKDYEFESTSTDDCKEIAKFINQILDEENEQSVAQ